MPKKEIKLNMTSKRETKAEDISLTLLLGSAPPQPISAGLPSADPHRLVERDSYCERPAGGSALWGTVLTAQPVWGRPLSALGEQIPDLLRPCFQSTVNNKRKKDNRQRAGCVPSQGSRLGNQCTTGKLWIHDRELGARTGFAFLVCWSTFPLLRCCFCLVPPLPGSSWEAVRTACKLHLCTAFRVEAQVGILPIPAEGHRPPVSSGGCGPLLFCPSAGRCFHMCVFLHHGP